MLTPRPTPCGSCPYRCDVPSGVWHPEEYAKLPQYDNETFAQPPGIFMCHSNKDGQTMCRGWLDVHPKGESLALRLAVMTGQTSAEIFDLAPSGVPVFASGAEAAKHGMREVACVSDEAAEVIRKLRAAKRRK